MVKRRDGVYEVGLPLMLAAGSWNFASATISETGTTTTARTGRTGLRFEEEFVPAMENRVCMTVP